MGTGGACVHQVALAGGTGNAGTGYVSWRTSRSTSLSLRLLWAAFCSLSVPSVTVIGVLWVTLACSAVYASPTERGSTVQNLIDAAGSSIFHLDLHARRKNPSVTAEGEATHPWFKGFGGSELAAEEVGSATAAAAAATTVSHPIRRMLSLLHQEEVGLEEALSWTEGQGSTGYQLVDNYLVRVLGGQSAWVLPPGDVGKAELHAARVALGKFEVIMRQDCLSADLPLLGPYLGRVISADEAAREAGAWENFDEAGGAFLSPGAAAEKLVRGNRWDLQLWNFAEKLILSRSTTLDSYLCSWGKAGRAQRTPGAGRRAVVYNSPNFHTTGVSMFSCVLMSWGFHVTAIMQEPQVGFEELLPCPHQIVSLDHALTPGDPYKFDIINSTVSYSLGLPPWKPAIPEGKTSADGEDKSAQADVGDDMRRRKTVSLEFRRAGDERKRLFDVSVLCTIFKDLEALLGDRHPMDPRLVDALLWDVKASIWNLHGVTRALADGTVPAAARTFAAGIPSHDGRSPPATFLTLYGEHVKTWEKSLEEAYEGWNGETQAGGEPSAVKEQGRGGSNLGGLFRRPGVVYPILPTGHMRLPRSSSRSSFSGEDVEDGGKHFITFVVQGKVESSRRTYTTLLTCLEEMCLTGRADFFLDVVGSGGDLKEALEAYPCTNARYTEGTDLRYEDFYARITSGDFVVTASAGQEYEYDRATSSVPTALLLEKPLVMSSRLLDAYPCLRNCRVHSQVANDDLCLNLHAAYDLTSAEYDEMELEARDCKIQMWRQTRETVAGMISGWVLD